MLITNGKKIVLLPDNPEQLNELAKDLKKRAKDVLSKKAKFEVKEDENGKFTYIENTDEFTFDELRQICLPDLDLKFRAIGVERVQMPTKKLKTIRHEFTHEEKEQIADLICNTQQEKEKLEDEKKAANKHFSSQIEKLEGTISNNAKMHRQGYELQDKECYLHLDFETKARIYTDIETGDILHSEAMVSEDFQMMINFGEDGLEEPAQGTADDKEEDDPFAE